jgi:EAL domain-containing protein (putative c-di-GMP-specific phosphodiesterase class I)
VRTVLAETGLPPQCLELEITESMAMLNQEFSLSILQTLSEMGVQVAVDDFGMGSALDFLRYFPIDTLKIDQSFVKEMTGESDDQAFITAIIAMAHSLKLKVVAEGVETETQLGLLQDQNCDEWQGYLFSQPLSTKEITKLLKSGQNYSTTANLYS